MAYGYWLAGHVTVIVLLTLFVDEGVSIKCHVCNSVTDGRKCDDKLEDCSKMADTGLIITDACEMKTRYRDDGSKTVSKSCVAGPCGLGDKSQNKALDIHRVNCNPTRKDSQYVKICTLCCKSGDGCNAGSGSRSVHVVINHLCLTAAMLFFYRTFV